MIAAPSNLSVLLDRVRDGDESALADLLLFYERPLRRAARALIGPMLRPQFDSVDVVQSVYRGLLPGLREGKYALDGPDQLVALALKAIRNKIIGKWRRAEIEERMRRRVAETAQGTEPIRRAQYDPIGDAERRELVERVLNELDPADRQLVEWRIAGLTPSEIASRLGCDAHALRARLSRLRQRLKPLDHLFQLPER